MPCNSCVWLSQTRFPARNSLFFALLRVQTHRMRKPSAIAFALILAAGLSGALAGCSQAMQWYRADTTQEAAELDAKECRAAAHDEAYRESYYYGPPFYSFPYYGPRGTRHWRDPFYDPFFARDMREQDLQDFCLRSRGYRLVPMPAGAAAPTAALAKPGQ